MFEKFTDRARQAVVLAQDEARRLNHNYIGTEHILLGLRAEEEGIAAKALDAFGISLDAVREQVLDIIGMGQSEPSGHIPFTPRAKMVLELANQEATMLGHNYIGTEHILLGLIREGEGVGAQMLMRLGADLNHVRQKVIELLTGDSTESEPPKRGVVTTAKREGQTVTISVVDKSGRPVEILGVSVRFRESDGVIRKEVIKWPRLKKLLKHLKDGWQPVSASAAEAQPAPAEGEVPPPTADVQPDKAVERPIVPGPTIEPSKPARKHRRD